MEYVTLVDADGNPIGAEEKLKAHRNEGVLHLAFSIFIFNEADEFLLQRRADDKYHFAGLWSNSCCGHPLPGESVTDGAHRRLKEELGFGTSLTRQGSMVYEAHDPDSGLTEREYLHTFTGTYGAAPKPARKEVSAWRWLSAEALAHELKIRPESFTPWFRLLMESVDLDNFNRDEIFNTIEAGATLSFARPSKT